MGCKDNYDEKQMQDRGKAFQAGFIAALVTTVALFFITDVVEIKIDSAALFSIQLWIPTTVCSVMAIVKDAYDGLNYSAGKRILTFLGVMGAVLLIMEAVFLFKGKESLIENGCITRALGDIVCGVCAVLLCVVYWVKRRRNRRDFAEE